jgi:phosphate butyryltransferase
MLKSFDSLAFCGDAVPTIVLAGAADEHSMEALDEARSKWGFDYLLCEDAYEAVAKAASLIEQGRGSALMKGGISTGTLLKAVLDKERGIGRGGLMSHMAVFESPHYHKLMFVTDGGMVPSPDLAKKSLILKNALDFLRGLGYRGADYDGPKVAALCASETVSDKMPETVDAFELARLAALGDFGPCILEGPISFDLAVCAESARLKGFDSLIAGDTDLFLMPDISSGNILGKALIYMGGSVMAGCVLGAKVPVILTSRGASAQEKMLSMALALAVK